MNNLYCPQCGSTVRNDETNPGAVVCYKKCLRRFPKEEAMRFKQVTIDEFYEFVDSHPELERDVTLISEPPCLHYNDFSNEKIWPESMVAMAKLNKETYSRKPNEYFLLKPCDKNNNEL